MHSYGQRETYEIATKFCPMLAALPLKYFFPFETSQP